MSFKPLALLGALLLAGCNDDLMTLRFQDSAGSAAAGLGTLKQAQIDALLTARQIDPQSLRWRVDLEDKHLVYVSELKPLSDAQHDALRTLFDPLMQARAASTMDIEVTLDIPAQQRQELSPVQREQIDGLPQPLIIKLALDPDILTMAQMPRGNDDVPGDLMEQVNSKVNCQLQARPVEPLPAGVTALWTVTLDTAGQVSVEMGEWSYPARYRFKDADLQRRVQSGELWLLPATYMTVSSLTVELGFAELGQHRLYSHFPLQQNASALIRECEVAANALPRPLSFHVGEGLDRLETVTYKDASQ
ncbi:hypothetical protein [Pseudomonas aegrilactucae]|uniref:Lipoprotein n=1 Tax=Pseudomonas aegrilactucae TaxID=2854028 RepID=A0A9Q2XHU6_9PSED|nr:hypothetical protein [Pseudomonas aegrilactucae]MBV6286361.1 hypothetical protein [Pseudomonas aegrilactucae]